MTRRCRSCKLDWTVSSLASEEQEYICPKCSKRAPKKQPAPKLPKALERYWRNRCREGEGRGIV